VTQPHPLFEVLRTELAKNGFQSPKSAPQLNVRPFNSECWFYVGIQGIPPFINPICAVTLPELGATFLKLMPAFRSGAPKDFDGRFMPPLLHTPPQDALEFADPTWAPKAAVKRGNLLGPDEVKILAEDICASFERSSHETWSEARVMEQLLSGPHDHPHAAWRNFLAPLWFARRGDWEAFDSFVEDAARSQSSEPAPWSNYIARVRALHSKTA
jgi:hypothetical protein